MDQNFWDDYTKHVENTSRMAHMIAVRCLQIPMGPTDSSTWIDPGLLMDYSSAMREMVSFLADHDYIEAGCAFVHTDAQGPVIVESFDDQLRVFRFNREELRPEDVSDDDKARIHSAWVRCSQ